MDNEIETATPTPTRAPRRNTDSQPATDPDALFRSAESARRSNDFEQARRLYLQFLEQSPNHAAANAHLARIYFDEDADHRTALQYQRRAVEAAPGNINHRLQLGMLHYRLTQYQEAIDVWEKVLEVEPNNTDAQRWIGLAEGSMN